MADEVLPTLEHFHLDGSAPSEASMNSPGEATITLEYGDDDLRSELLGETESASPSLEVCTSIVAGAATAEVRSRSRSSSPQQPFDAIPPLVHVSTPIHGSSVHATRHYWPQPASVARPRTSAEGSGTTARQSADSSIARRRPFLPFPYFPLRDVHEPRGMDDYPRFLPDRRGRNLWREVRLCYENRGGYRAPSTDEIVAHLEGRDGHSYERHRPTIHYISQLEYWEQYSSEQALAGRSVPRLQAPGSQPALTAFQRRRECRRRYQRSQK